MPIAQPLCLMVGAQGRARGGTLTPVVAISHPLRYRGLQQTLSH